MAFAAHGSGGGPPRGSYNPPIKRIAEQIRAILEAKEIADDLDGRAIAMKNLPGKKWSDGAVRDSGKDYYPPRKPFTKFPKGTWSEHQVAYKIDQMNKELNKLERNRSAATELSHNIAWLAHKEPEELKKYPQVWNLWRYTAHDAHSYQEMIYRKEKELWEFQRGVDNKRFHPGRMYPKDIARTALRVSTSGPRDVATKAQAVKRRAVQVSDYLRSLRSEEGDGG